MIDRDYSLSFLAKPLQEMLYEEQVLNIKNLKFPWPEEASVFQGEMDESYCPESRPVFQLPYYLIPEDKAHFVQSESLNLGLKEQLIRLIDKVKYFILFVHPEAVSYYSQMNEFGFKFIAEKASEFFASPTSSYRSLLVWTKEKKPAFIAKLSINKIIFANERINTFADIEACIGTQKLFDSISSETKSKARFAPFPEVAGLILNSQTIDGMSLGGQIIREIPEDLSSGSLRWISLAACCANGKASLLLEIIRQTGLSPVEFIRHYFLDAFLIMVEVMNFQLGISFLRLHTQNLLIETNVDLKPTGRFIIRDFSDIRYEFPFLIHSGLNFSSLKSIPHLGASNSYFSGGAYLEQTFYSYHELSFKVILEVLKTYDNGLTDSEALDLSYALKVNFLKLISHYVNEDLALEDIYTTKPFPALSLMLSEQGSYLFFKSLKNLPLGEELLMDLNLQNYLKNKIQLGYWHDFFNILDDSIISSAKKLQIFLHAYRFYRYKEFIFAKDETHTVIGFTFDFIKSSPARTLFEK